MRRPRIVFALDFLCAIKRARVSPRRAWKIARLLRRVRERQLRA